MERGWFTYSDGIRASGETLAPHIGKQPGDFVLVHLVEFGGAAFAGVEDVFSEEGLRDGGFAFCVGGCERVIVIVVAVVVAAVLARAVAIEAILSFVVTGSVFFVFGILRNAINVHWI